MGSTQDSNQNIEVKKTPLCESHKKLGAKMVNFAGWYMPVEYQGLRAEHQCVREKVGLFDVSHMGEVRFKGPKALETLEWLTTNHVSKLNDGEAQYSLLPNEKGGLVDDIIVYCLKKNVDYLVCVNASNSDKDFQWMTKNNRGAEITNESTQWGQIAVQGPSAHRLISATLGFDATQLKPFKVKTGQFQGTEFIFASTGYTGESGGEIFIRAEGTEKLWDALLANGQSLGVQPIGLGARDTLRTEMKYSLYGHEIDDTTNPFESGLNWVVKPSAKEFMGKPAMLAKIEKGPAETLVGFKMIDKGIPRQGYEIYSDAGEKIGFVTSGTLSPSLGVSIGIGRVAKKFDTNGTEFFVDIRGKRIRAQVCPTPFWTRQTT